MGSNPVSWSVFERWTIFAKTEVVALQVCNLLIQARFVYLTFVGHGTIFILECRFFEAIVSHEIGFNVFKNCGLSLVFSNIVSTLGVMLKHLCRVVDSITLTHMEVRLWES
jgi:hypothetical protein